MNVNGEDVSKYTLSYTKLFVRNLSNIKYFTSTVHRTFAGTYDERVPGTTHCQTFRIVGSLSADKYIHVSIVLINEEAEYMYM